MLIVALVIAIAIILFCIIVLKLNASIGMVLASLFMGVAGGLDLMTTMDTISSGFGSMMTSIGLPVGFGTILGQLMSDSGAADIIADKLVSAFPEKRSIWGLSPEEIISEEPKLKEISYKTIAHLLFDKCDVLVVDKIGKNISGDGMDPNVSGRFVQPKYCSGGIQAEKCVILDLTDETHGNAQGIGLAEVTTRRLFNKMKLEMTYPTGVTNTFLHLMKIPMIMDNDREALQLALMCCPEAEDHDHMKMIRIPNTAHIGVIEISEGMLPLVENNPDFEVLTEPYDLPFDENGNLF